jgi:hypothetical protein
MPLQKKSTSQYRQVGFTQAASVLVNLDGWWVSTYENPIYLLSNLDDKYQTCRYYRRSNALYQQLRINLVSDANRMDLRSGSNHIFSHRPTVPLKWGVLNPHRHIHNSLAQGLGAGCINLRLEGRDYRPRRLGRLWRLIF